VAVGVTALSAIGAGACIGVVVIICLILTRSRLAALIGAASLAVSPMFITLATIAEVYTLAAAALAIMMLWLLYWRQKRRPEVVLAAALAGGLGVGIHGTVGLAAMPAALYLIMSRKASVSTWLSAAAGVAIALAVDIAFLVLADRHHAAGDIFRVVYEPSRSLWGPSGMFATLSGRLGFLLGSTPWRGLMLSNWSDVPTRFAAYLAGLIRQFTLLGACLAAIGVGAICKEGDRALACLMFGTLIFNLLFTLTYQIADIETLYIQGYVVIAIMVACGAARVERWCRDVRRGSVVWACIGACLLVGTVVPPLSAMRTIVGERRLANTDDDLRATVAALPLDATVLCDWSDVYARMYVAYIELHRSDLTFIEAKPYSGAAGLAGSLLDFARASLKRGPVYFVRDWPDLHTTDLGTDLEVVGSEPLYRLSGPTE
jgi:hypothetical protein